MHECPDCGQACYCNGDIDDIDFGCDSEEAMNCMHYRICEGQDEDDEDDGCDLRLEDFMINGGQG